MKTIYSKLGLLLIIFNYSLNFILSTFKNKLLSKLNIMARIIYTVIANNISTTPLAEISLASGNFQVTALRLLEKMKAEEDTSKVYEYENEYKFYYHNKEGISVLCMADNKFSNIKAFDFLFEIREKVLKTYGSQVKEAIGFSIKRHFNKEIEEIMIKYNKEKDDSKIGIVIKNVQVVKEIMVQNIDKIIDRGEKIEILVEKSNELQNNAVVFSKTSNQVKRHFLCKNIKLSLIIGLILVGIVFFIVVLCCGGFDFQNCR
jgi:Synaptobrevin/VAMP-like protein